MLRNVLNLHEIRVEDVMVPRADMVAVDVDASLKDVLAVFREASHSRLPVHGESLDDPKGMVHIRDFVDVITATETDGAPTVQVDMGRSLADAGILRPVLFVPPSMLALDLLVRMQATRTHMALVIDEYGGTDGLVTIEDIVEVIVGDIADEHDEVEGPMIVERPDGALDLDARLSIEDFETRLGQTLTEDEREADIDTVGGLVFTLAGRVPARGEVISHASGLEFRILDADARRIRRRRARRPVQQAAE